MVSSAGESLVTIGDSYRTVAIPSPQSHVWGWKARIMAWRIWVRSKKKCFLNSMTWKFLTIFRKKKLLYHANWLPSASVRKWIPLTSGIHFMAPAPVWVQQSSLTDVKERLMALHWDWPICRKSNLETWVSQMNAHPPQELEVPDVVCKIM